MSSYFKKGSWNAVCDVCGFEFKSHELKQRWDGLKVCKEDWEVRHPLDFQRAKVEKAPPPWTRPDDTEDDITITNIGNNASSTITASLYTRLYYYTTTGAGTGTSTVTFPSANDSTWNNVPVILTISILPEATDGSASVRNLTISATGLIGSSTVLLNTSNATSAQFRSIPSQNIWIRE